MMPGQDPGRPGLTWADYIDGLVRDRGSLAAVAMFVAERRGFAEEPESIERGLRRLRERTGDGGVWGQRLLGCFGLPREIDLRIRWMGQYHTRFTDLPVSLCAELLQPWDRPPVSESPARIWLLLGRANVALRRRDDAAPLLSQAGLLAQRAEPAARAELALMQAFVARDPEVVAQRLAEAEPYIDASEGEDQACLRARWIDQRAYRLNRPEASGLPGPPDHAAAALYESLPVDGPPFARCRRENGLGWSYLKLGDHARAQRHAEASVEAAGDSGLLRLRAMALKLLSICSNRVTPMMRASDIARLLEDEALGVRFR